MGAERGTGGWLEGDGESQDKIYLIIILITSFQITNISSPPVIFVLYSSWFSFEINKKKPSKKVGTETVSALLVVVAWVEVAEDVEDVEDAEDVENVEDVEDAEDVEGVVVVVVVVVVEVWSEV